MAAYSVLIVDDSSLMRKIVEKSVRSWNRPFERILHAEDGQQALDVIQQETADIVFSDMNMPQMTGLDLVQAAAKLPRPVPPIVLVTTEAPGEPRIDLALKSGAAGHVKKPFTDPQLHQYLSSLLPA